jgi:phosphoglycolate phosphatase-like HAD superfamily hydrolase
MEGVTRALVLFDIDGTLMRKSGPQHRESLEDAIRIVTGRLASIADIPVAGMLDGDILTRMMRAAGLRAAEIPPLLPAVIEKAQLLYSRRCPDLRRRVCPGVRRLLPQLHRRGAVTGLVTGNLSRIAWKKMDRAGLRSYFRYGAFAEMARTRAQLARLARRRALDEGWITRRIPVLLIGDHPNDVLAAKRSGCTSIAVATGVAGRLELAGHQPDHLLDDLRSFDFALLDPAYSR